MITTLSLLDKSTIAHGPHDKVLPLPMLTKDQGVTSFPASADALISKKTPLLLSASPLPQPLLHLSLGATVFCIWDVN